MSLADDIGKIEEQELRLHFSSFNENDGWSLGCQMREAAVAARLPLVIDIRVGQRQLFYTALPGTAADNFEWVRRKFNSVLRFQKSTYLLNRMFEQRGGGFDATRGINAMDHAKDGGGFPLHIEGTGVVGAITVSGIPQRDDHGFVVNMLCQYLKIEHDALKLGPERA